MKKYFIVTCHGWSASNWTAHSLNLNSKIICTHSARNEIAEDKELQSNKNLKKNINKLQSGYKKRQAQSLDAIYDEIECKGASPYYGSVHVLRLRDIPIIYEKFGISQRSFNLVNIVRHPIDLVWSGYGQFLELFRYDINELHWTSGKVVNQALKFSNYIGQKYNLYMGDIENLAFIGACAIMESLKKDIDAYISLSSLKNINFCGTFKMEEITNDPKIYSLFCSQLGLNELISEEYLNKVFSTGVVNKHKSDDQKLSSKERYLSLVPWQKEVFNHFFNLHDLKKPYEKFGYDFTYL